MELVELAALPHSNGSLPHCLFAQFAAVTVQWPWRGQSSGGRVAVQQAHDLGKRRYYLSDRHG